MYWNQNVQALCQGQPQAPEWLKTLEQTPVTQDAQLFNTATGDYSLLYRGVYLHSLQGAIPEAEDTAQKHCKPALGRPHLILGIGLGYLLEATFQRSPGQIVIYEPDLPLLKFILENVDLTDALGSGRVSIATTRTEALNSLAPYITSEDPLDVLVVPGYAQLMHAEIPKLMDELFRVVEDRIRDLKTGQYFHQQWTRQFFQNLPYFAYTTPFASLAEIYRQKPAMIIGRGPSLDGALEDIKALASSMTLIAAGSALHRLCQAGITPDIAVFYDPNGIKEQLNGLPDTYLQEIVFAISPFTDSLCFETPCKAKILCYSQNGEAFAQWLAFNQPKSPLLSEPLIVEGGGTVSLIALQLAKALQSSQIILVGQDLAFPNNQVYAGGIAVQQDEQGRLALQKQDDLFTAPEAMTTVLGQDHQPLPALKAYASFIRHFEKIATDNAAQDQLIPLYNASLGGAAIQGYALSPLSAFRDQFPPFKPASNPNLTLQHPIQKLEQQAPRQQIEIEALRQALSSLKQDLYEAIRLHEATLPENQITNPNTKQSLFDFLNGNPLISHFLMFEMLTVQQRYNPQATSKQDISENQVLLQQSQLNCIDILRNQVLPQVIHVESQLLSALCPDSKGLHIH